MSSQEWVGGPPSWRQLLMACCVLSRREQKTKKLIGVEGVDGGGLVERHVCIHACPSCDETSERSCVSMNAYAHEVR